MGTYTDDFGDGSIGSEWTYTDADNTAGTTAPSEANGELTLYGYGADMWRSTDEYTALTQPIDGDFTAEIKINDANVSNAGNYAEAGIGAFNGVDQPGVGAYDATVAYRNQPSVFQAKVDTDGDGFIGEVEGAGSGSPPLWLRLDLSGNTFTYEYATSDPNNGGTWFTINTESVTAPSTYDVGLFCCAHSSSTELFVDVEYIEITGPNVATAISLTASAPTATGTVGTSTFDSGTTTLTTDAPTATGTTGDSLLDPISTSLTTDAPTATTTAGDGVLSTDSTSLTTDAPTATGTAGDGLLDPTTTALTADSATAMGTAGDGTLSADSTSLTASAPTATGTTGDALLDPVSTPLTADGPTATASVTGSASIESSSSVDAGQEWSTAADWDAAVSESGVVHESFGDLPGAGTVQLGYPSSAPNLEAYFPLDEDSGTTAADVTGNGYDGTIDSATLGQTGINGSTCFDFNGTDGHVTIGGRPVDLSQAFTFSARVYFDSLDSDQTVISQETHNGLDCQLRYDSGDNVWMMNLNDATSWRYAESTTTPYTDDWVSLVGVHRPSIPEIQVYVNGNPEGTDITDGDVPNSATSDASIGARDNGASRNVDGRIDDVRFYQAALTDAEVLDLHQAGTQGSLTTATKSIETAGQPDLEGLSYSLNGGSIAVDVIGSPGTVNEEVVTQSLDGATDYSLSWSNSHTDFRLELSLSSSSVETSPDFSSATIITSSPITLTADGPTATATTGDAGLFEHGSRQYNATFYDTDLYAGDSAPEETLTASAPTATGAAGDTQLDPVSAPLTADAPTTTGTAGDSTLTPVSTALTASAPTATGTAGDSLLNSETIFLTGDAPVASSTVGDATLTTGTTVLTADAPTATTTALPTTLSVGELSLTASGPTAVVTAGNTQLEPVSAQLTADAPTTQTTAGGSSLSVGAISITASAPIVTTSVGNTTLSPDTVSLTTSAPTTTVSAGQATVSGGISAARVLIHVSRARGEFDLTHTATGEFDLDRIATGEFDLDRTATGEHDLDRLATGEFDLDRIATGEALLVSDATGEHDLERDATGEYDLEREATGQIDDDDAP